VTPPWDNKINTRRAAAFGSRPETHQITLSCAPALGTTTVPWNGDGGLGTVDVDGIQRDNSPMATTGAESTGRPSLTSPELGLWPRPSGGRSQPPYAPWAGGCL